MSRIEKAMEKAVTMRRGEFKPHPESIADARIAKSPQPSGIPHTKKVHADIDHPYLVSITDPKSPIAEEYRKLKESVIKKSKKNGFRNMIMVTSPYVGEGKSVTALNLVASLAQEYNHTALLVDGDLRRPACADYLGLKPQLGLTDCIQNGQSVGDAFLRVEEGNFTILPAGSIVSNPGELFSSEKMRNTLLEMKSRYADRFIVIDTPPVLPFAETRVLASVVDSVILVVKENLSTQQDIMDTLEALKGVEVLGVVYNQAEVQSRRSSYYYYDYSKEQKSG